MNVTIFFVFCFIVTVISTPLAHEVKDRTTIRTTSEERSINNEQAQESRQPSFKEDLIPQETFHYWVHRPLWGGWLGYYRPYHYRWHIPQWGGFWHPW